MARILVVLMVPGIILRGAVLTVALCTPSAWAGADSENNTHGLASDVNFQSISPPLTPGQAAPVKIPPEDTTGPLDDDSNHPPGRWEQHSSNSDGTTPAYGWDNGGGGHFMDYLAGAAALLAIYLPVLLWHSTHSRSQPEARPTRSRARRKRRSTRFRTRPANFETSRRDPP